MSQFAAHEQAGRPAPSRTAELTPDLGAKPRRGTARGFRELKQRLKATAPHPAVSFPSETPPDPSELLQAETSPSQPEALATAAEPEAPPAPLPMPAIPAPVATEPSDDPELALRGGADTQEAFDLAS